MHNPSPSDPRWWDLLNRDWQEPGDLKGTLDRIAGAAREIFAADFCSIYAINPLTRFFVPVPGQAGDLWPGDGPDPIRTPREHGLTQRVIDEGLLVIEDSADLPRDEAGFCRRQGVKSFAAAALHTLRNPRPFAVLYVDYRAARPLTTDFQSKLKEFARLASHKLQATWFLRRYQRIGEIGQKINGEIETEEKLFLELRSMVGSIIDISRCFLWAVHRPAESCLDVFSRIDGQLVIDRGQLIDGPLLRLIQRLDPLQIRSLRDETAKRLREVEGLPRGLPWQPESLLFVPLVLGGRSFGVLSVQHPEPAVYDDEDRHLLALLGTQVAQAMSNQRLFVHLRRLLAAGQTLTQKLETEGVLQAIVEAIRETTGCDLAVLYPYVAASDSFKLPPGLSGELRVAFPQPRYLESAGVPYSVLRQERPIYAEDAEGLLPEEPSGTRRSAPPFQEREKILSVAALPLRAGGEPVGALFVNYRTRQAFSEDPGLRHLLEGLARYAAIAIKNARLLGAEKSRYIKSLETLREFDRQLSRTNDLGELLVKILELAVRRLREEGREVDEASLLLFDRGREELVTQAAVGSHREKSLQQVLRPEDGRGVALEVLRTKRSVLVEDVRATEWRDRYLAVGEQTRCELDVPLLDGEEVVGILNLESRRPGAFRETDMGLMEMLAGQAVLAVKKAQAYEQEQRMREDEEALLELAKELTRRLDTEDLLDMIVKRAIGKTRAEAGVLVLVDQRHGDFVVKAERGVPDPRARIGRRINRKAGILGHVAQTGSMVNADLREAPWKELHIAAVEGMLSQLAMPLKLQGRVLGVLSVESPEKRYFNTRNERLITGLADLALIALQNAERFESARNRQQQLEALAELGRRVVDQLEDPDQVMRAIVGHAQRLTNATISELDLYEKGEWVTHYRAQRIEGGEPRVAELLDVRQPDARLPQPGIMGRVAQTKEALLVVGDAQDHPWYEGEEGIHSELAVPLLDAQEQLLGVLGVTSPALHAFDKEDQELLQLFAAQAVIAIENSRAYAFAERRRQHFELLHTVGQELAQISGNEGLPEAHKIVVDMVRKHLRSVVVVRRLDPAGEYLVRVESAHDEGAELFERIPLSDPLNGRAARRGETLRVDDAESPPKDIGPFDRSNPQDRSFLVAPIKFGADCYGTLALSHGEIAHFQEGEVLLAEGLAQQLAITIHRLEELEKRKQADRRALEAEAMSEIGREAYEITHRLGNDLGLVPRWLRKIRSAAEPIDSEIESLFEKAQGKVGSVLRFSRYLGDELSRLSAKGQLAPEPTSTPVRELIHDAMAGLELDKGDRIVIRTEIADDVGAVLVDPQQIANALLNLLANAKDAMPDGGTITVRASRTSSNVRVHVSDTGVGIPKEARHKVFRLGYSTKERAGFGLWSVKKTLAANSGSISLEGQSSRGTTFEILLPQASEIRSAAKSHAATGSHSEKDGAHPGSGSPGPPSSPAGRASGPDEAYPDPFQIEDDAGLEPVGGDLRILIVEDEPDWQAYIAELLQGEGYEIETAASKAEALEKIAHNTYDLMTLDLYLSPGNLNDQSWNDLIEKLPEAEKSRPKIVVVSAHSRDQRTREKLRGHQIEESDIYDKEELADPKLKAGFELAKVARELKERKLGENPELRIAWNDGLTAKRAVASLSFGKADETGTAGELDTELPSELVMLLQRLFFDADEVVLSRIAPGYSGGSVIRANPVRKHGKGYPVIVKFGEHQLIDQESYRYDNYVLPYLHGGTHSTSLDSRIAYYLGGIAYSFQGASEHSTRPFFDFYADSDTAKIEESLDNLFFQTCAKWYENSGRPSSIEIASSYLEWLNFSFKGVAEGVSSLPVSKRGGGLRLGGLGQGRVLSDPIAYLQRRSYSHITHSVLSHGDLSASNLFVDSTAGTWLIGFERTGEGHYLRDAIGLDTSVRLHLLRPEQATLKERALLEDSLTRDINSFQTGDPLRESLGLNQHLNKAFRTCYHIRRIAAGLVKRTHGLDNREFYTGAIICALDRVRSLDLPEIQREHALLSASIMAEFLERQTESGQH